MSNESTAAVAYTLTAPLCEKHDFYPWADHSWAWVDYRKCKVCGYVESVPCQGYMNGCKETNDWCPRCNKPTDPMSNQWNPSAYCWCSDHQRFKRAPHSTTANEMLLSVVLWTVIILAVLFALGV